MRCVTPQEAAEAALGAWATIQRDELVQTAHQAGVSKNRIHVLTGIARTTIDRILEAPVGTTQQALTEYLGRFTASWPRYQGWGWDPQSLASASYSAQQVADALFADAEFRALKLGTWLSTPEGELLTAAATALMPPLYAEDAGLLIDGLKMAAQQQQADARKTIVAAVTIGGAVLALAVGSSGK
jgi:hypothetical protein